MMESQAEKEEAVVDEKVLRVSDELTNGMLLDQVEELEEQKTKLLLSLKDLKEKYEQQKSDQADIYYYLNKKLDENYETIASLEEQILNEQTQREEQEKKLEKRIEELNLKLSSDETKYLAKINEAEEKLQKLKEFSDNKDELESNFEKLLETLELERKQYRELVDENERKSIRERDRFRKECAQQFDDYKLKLQDEADDKLSSRTKKTLNTNKMMKTELAYQSKQADQVLVYNQKVLDKDKELRQELDLTQTTQKEMVKRLALYQRLIKQLNEKVNNQETQISNLLHECNSALASKDKEIDTLRQQLADEHQKRKSRSRKSQDDLLEFMTAKFKGLNKIENERSGKTKSTDAILEELISQVLQQFPERFSRVSKDDSSEGFFPPLDTSTQRNGKSKRENDLITGISAWDTARASSKENWWSSFSKEVDPDVTDETTIKSQIGIQTEGRILHYPPGSKWLNGAECGSSTSKYYIDQDETHMSNVQHTGATGRKAANKAFKSGIVHSPLKDPLHRKSKKNRF